MKKIVFVLVSLVVAILVIGGNAFAHIPNPSLGPEWRLVFIGPNNGSTGYVNTKKIIYLPKGIVKVWTLWVSRGEERRRDINVLKEALLSKGEDPNDAERLWYIIFLYKVNCKNNQFATLEGIAYSFGKAVLDIDPVRHEEWIYIPPGTVAEKIEKFVCKERK